MVNAVGGSLTTNMFENIILGVHLPTVVEAQKKWAEKNTKQEEEGKTTEVPTGVAGRKLADAISGA